MTKVGKARISAANICGRYSGFVRGITAVRLTVLSLCTVAAVLCYTVARPALINFSWDLKVAEYSLRVDENILLEAALWLLLYIAYVARYASVSRLVAIGRVKRHKLQPYLLALLPVIVFFVPLRLLAINVIGRANSRDFYALVDGWRQNTLHLVLLGLAAVCAVALVALLFMAMDVFTTRAIVNRHVLGRAKLGRALKQGFQHCLAPLATCLKYLFWIVSAGMLIAEFSYLTAMQYSVPWVYVGMGALLLAGFWLCGFGPDFWSRYHVTFICLVRRLTDADYADMKEAEE